MNETNHLAEDEIDLVELAKTFWRGRRMIAAVMGVMLLAASMYLNVVDRKYTVSMVVQPGTCP